MGNIIYVSLAGALLAGCWSAEVGLSRQGRFAGDAAGGGLGVVASGAVYYEDGKQNGSAGFTDQTLFHASAGEATRTLGGGLRYARQITASPRWRVFGRGAFGLAVCDWTDCGEREMDAPSARMLGFGLGIERFAWVPDPDNPRDTGWLSTSLGVVYTRTTHETLGDGDFLGIELGLRVGLNVLVSVAQP